MSDQDDLMTVRDVARVCNRSEETVRRWIWSGKLRARKLGNQMFVARKDLEAMRAPRTAEAKVRYRANAGQGVPRTQKEKLAFAQEILELGREMEAKYGSVNVTELIRDVREEEND